jgi:hypothetical protein
MAATDTTKRLDRGYAPAVADRWNCRNRRPTTTYLLPLLVRAGAKLAGKARAGQHGVLYG